MGGYRKIPDRYSPFFDALSDKKSREEHSRDQAEYFNPQNNIFSGQSEFEAVVLQMPMQTTNGSTDQNTDIKFDKTRLRVKGLSELTFSEPCEFKVPGEEQQNNTKMYSYVVCWHPEGLADRKAGESQTSQTSGDIVIAKHQQGPSFMGRQRGLTYAPHVVGRAPGYADPPCPARLAMQAEEGTMSPLGGSGGGVGSISVGAKTSYAGDAYEPSLPTSRPYTPRPNKGSPYNPRGPAKKLTSDQRGPSYNGPDGVAVHPWQVVGACHPTHPNRTRITARFAQKRSTGPHSGVDIGHAGDGPGEPMYAVLDGKISALNHNSKSAGGLIHIKHKAVRKDGKEIKLLTKYMHCEAIYVKSGETVKKGQHIADMGNTGNSYGCHLHFGLRLNYTGKVNPNVMLGLLYPYSSGAKKEIEQNNGEVVSTGGAIVEGATTTVQVNATVGTKISSTTSTASTLLDSYKSRQSKQEGDEFVVDGVKYISKPAADAAIRASELRKSAVAAVPSGQYNNSFESTPAGRKWVVENMYEIGRPGSGASWGPKLGTDGESFWSSWFFKVACLNWWKEPGMDVGKKNGGTYYDYSADEGLRQRNTMQGSPQDWVGKEMFITFRPSEAPLFVGDAVFSGRGGGPTKFSNILAGGPSHMRVITKIVKSGDGFVATVNGGNEGQRVGEGTFKMNADRTMKAGSSYGKSKYLAVYKHVKVISPIVS